MLYILSDILLFYDAIIYYYNTFSALSILYYTALYHTIDVPSKVLDELKKYSHVEIVDIPDGQGYVSGVWDEYCICIVEYILVHAVTLCCICYIVSFTGMFWRFLVASDGTVDRYIVRDVDSRLNARDRFAVEKWLTSKDHKGIHIMRDHVNHCIPMNGGMWGGTKGVLSNMEELVKDWEGSRDAYSADLDFLRMRVYPLIKENIVVIRVLPIVFLFLPEDIAPTNMLAKCSVRMMKSVYLI